MNIFITGNRGLIGTFLEKRLKEEGHNIVGSVDLRDEKALHLLKNLRSKIKIDLLIHAAAFCKINKAIEFPHQAHINNSAGTFHALEFCRKNKIPKFVFFSSSRVLSSEKNTYTASKIYGEELCKAYSECYGINYLIIRPSTVYGPFWDTTSRLIHIYITAALANKDLHVYGDPKTKTLDFTYIDDFVDAILISLQKDKWDVEYNISGEEEHNIYDLAKWIIKETKSKSKIKVFNKEIAQPQKVKVNILKTKKIGYKPKVSLKEGVKKTIEWYSEFVKRNSSLLE